MRDSQPQKSGEVVENFYMYVFKITTCPTKYAHDWTSCPYAHSGESARRRQPHLYKPIPCPESKGGNPCPRGDSCKYAHNDFEYWLHPARYKTEYCKQGPGCNRKICFFAHRPDEIRTAPAVVFTKQGPFVDSATTARKKHRLEQALSVTESADGGCPMPASPWNTRSRTQSGTFSYLSSFGDAKTGSVMTMHGNSVQGYQSPRQQLHGFSSSCSMGSQRTPRSFEERYPTNVAELHAALNALSLTSTPTTPLGDVSPLTPTTPWSLTQTPCNPFVQMAAESMGSCPDRLLSYLHGIQTQQASLTPRSMSEYVSPRQSLSAGEFQGLRHRHPTSTTSATLGQGLRQHHHHHYTTTATPENDLMSLAQMIKGEATKGDSILYSSLSDGVIHRGGPTPGSLFFNDAPPSNDRSEI